MIPVGVVVRCDHCGKGHTVNVPLDMLGQSFAMWMTAGTCPRCGRLGMYDVIRPQIGSPVLPFEGTGQAEQQLS